ELVGVARVAGAGDRAGLLLSHRAGRGAGPDGLRDRIGSVATRHPIVRSGLPGGGGRNRRFRARPLSGPCADEEMAMRGLVQALKAKGTHGLVWASRRK